MGIIGFAAIFSSCTREIPISKSEDTYNRTKPTKYDWNVITQYKSLTTSSPATTKDKVSTLLYDIARAGNTEFRPEKNVGSTLVAMATPAIQSLGYHVKEHYYGSKISSDSIEIEMVAQRPCLLAGQGPSGGQIWVVDGLYRQYRWCYRTSLSYDSSLPMDQGGYTGGTLYRERQRISMIHCNWGWGGTSNGWYFSFTPYNNRLGQNIQLRTELNLWTQITPK